MSPARPPSKEKHPIRVVARRTGLSPDVIRAWERRYGAVSPSRTSTSRRLYSDEDVERLLLLAQVTAAGRRIGDVARLSPAKLRAMVEEDREAASRVGVSGPAASGATSAERHLAAALEAVRTLDAAALERVLGEAAMHLAAPLLIDGVLVPLMSIAGELWRSGELRPAHEHLLTAVVRSFLGSRGNGVASEPAPELVVATPTGQRHELGALIAAVAAAADGWRVTYLGADLPAEDIAAATLGRGARAVALSIIFPADDPRMVPELRTLRARLGEKIALLVGGASARSYAGLLDAVDARVLTSFGELREALRALRADGAR